MLSLSYAGKNAYSTGKTSGVLRGDASGSNRCYVLTACPLGREGGGDDFVGSWVSREYSHFNSIGVEAGTELDNFTSLI